MTSLLEILQQALQLESDTEVFYEEAAECAGNVLAEKTFRALAEQERQHATYFKTYYERMSETSQWPPMDSVVMSGMSTSETARDIHQRVTAELGASCDVNEDLEQLYDRAMELERRSIELYQKQAKEAEDADRRKFFAWLTDQERGHLQILARTHEFLHDPASWYTEDEQWFVTG